MAFRLASCCLATICTLLTMREERKGHGRRSVRPDLARFLRKIYSCSQHLTTPPGGWGGVASGFVCKTRWRARAHKRNAQTNHATLGSRPAPARLF